MTYKEKIRDAAKKEWMKWLYKIYRRAYCQHSGNYDGCLTYKQWLDIRIDLYNPID